MTLATTSWLAPDAALPQRDALLDSAVVAECVARSIRPGHRVRVDRCERVRVNYQIGKSLRVLHRVEIEGCPMTVSARAFREDRVAAAYRAAAADPFPVQPDATPAVFVSGSMNTVFWVFPNDRKITGLDEIIDGSITKTHPLPVEWHSTHLLAYAPEKSATLACLDYESRVTAYAKVTAGNQAAQDYLRYRALEPLAARHPLLRLPRALAHVPQRHLLILEPLGGRRMHDPSSDAAMDDVARFGAALAAFHSFDFPDAPTFARFAPDRLVDARRQLTSVRPDVGGSVDALVSDLMSRRPEQSAQSVCLHGDVHAKNAILAEDRIALIDLEDLAAGPAAADIGSFLASMRYLRCGGVIRRNVDRALRAAFLGGYASIRPLPSAEEVRWHTSAALLIERILRAITRMRPLGLSQMPELLSAARTVLTESCDE